MSDGCQNYDRGQLPPRQKSGGKPVTKIGFILDDCTKKDRKQIANALIEVAKKIELMPTLQGGATSNVAWSINETRNP